MTQNPLRQGDALVLVDVQNDFCPGGALPVPDGDKVVPVLNQWIRWAREKGLPVFASQDWHPEGHASFKEQGGPWPRHCVQGTQGAELHADLQLPEVARVVRKGSDTEKDQYSAFDGTRLAHELRELRVTRVFVGGLAQDVCVRATALDGLDAGFGVVLIDEATRPVDAQKGRKALEEVRDAGGTVLTEPLVGG